LKYNPEFVDDTHYSNNRSLKLNQC